MKAFEKKKGYEMELKEAKKRIIRRNEYVDLNL